MAGLAVGLLLGGELVWRLASSRAELLGSIAAVGAALLGGMLAARRHAPVAMCLAGVLGGLVVGALYWNGVAVAGARIADAQTGAWTVECVTDATQGSFGASSLARVVGPPTVGATVKVQWPKGVSAPAMGERVAFWGAAAPERDPSQALEAFRAGVATTLRARRVKSVEEPSGALGWIASARQWALSQTRSVPGDGAALLEGMLLGERTRIAASAADQDLKIAGLAHFEATSGFHVMLVAAIVQAVLASLGCRRRVRIVALSLLLVGFVVLAGARISAVRSACMALLAPAATSAGRRADPLAALAAVSAAFLCVSPSLIFDLGFQFSVCGVAGILVFSRLAEGWVAAGLGRRVARVSGSVAVTSCAVIATLPLAASAFGFVSIVAPLSNLCAVPLVVASFCAGMLGVALSVVSASVGHCVLVGASAIAGALCAVAGFFARIPGAALAVGSAVGIAIALWLGAGLALWIWWPQPAPWAARACMALAALWLIWSGALSPTASGPIVRVMDVGQGDAILVEDGPHALLVDTGPSGTAELQALGRSGIRHVDGVVITHLHADHYGGLEAVASVMHVPRLFFPLGTVAGHSAVVRDAVAETGVPAEELRDGDRLTVGSLELDVLSPASPVPNAATNEASVVMVVRDGGASVLLTGDAEVGVLSAIESRGELPRVDVLKVGHHGSAVSVDPAVLACLKPQVALISVGAHNRYGHPTQRALDTLARAAIRTYRTDRDGDLTVAMSDGRARVSVTGTGNLAVASAQRRRPPDASACGTLVTASPAQHAKEFDGFLPVRPQAGLPHLRNRGPPALGGARSPDQSRGRGCRSRLQLRYV